ncbi:hypothetical protein [Bradyrhizobium sp. SZCCHNR1098]|uniref:hypothetical protein n=1 Tax=Bradyrhizobium sp. SZCCHNR1098 TaxID=3057370 RepID=UPI002916C148|nr:hypothetical protein [Bradyrhizobium sp. SZCCHNR1098]
MAPPLEAAAAPPELTEQEREEQERNERAVREALARQRRAEELSAEMSRMSPVERELAQRFPDMTPAERWFVLQHPEVLHEDNVHFVAESYQRGQRIGLQRGSKELFALILDDIDTRQRAARGAESLDRDVERERLISAAQGGAPEIPAEPAVETASEPSLPAIPAPRKGMPMAAPVSRSEPPTYSGRPREPNFLTPEEREIARNSFSAPGMTNAQKEYLYLKNKQRYHQMVRDGTYTTERNR